MESIFNTLFSKTEKYVKNYRTDFGHDQKFIEKNPGLKFIHAARESGTVLIPFHKADIYPQKGERVKYLFGTAGRDELLSDMKETAIAYQKAETVKIWHFYDGKTVKKITFEKVIHEIERQERKIRREWELQETN